MLKQGGLAKSQVYAPDSSSGGATPRVGSNPTPATQRCRGKCGQTRPISAFHKDRVLKDGTQTYRSECKMCKAERQKAYYWANRDEIREYHAGYRAKNRERILAQKRVRYELIKADPVAWAAHIEYKSEWNRRKREANPELYREYARQYRARLRKDPKRLATFRQNRRMAYETRRRIRAEHGGYEAHTFELVDAKPFKDWMNSEREAGRSIEQLALGSGVSARSLRRVLDGQEKVKLDMVDRVTMANDVGLWELYDD